MQILHSLPGRLVLLGLLAIALGGTRACQENYFFASQSTVTGSPTDSATATFSPDTTLTPEPSEDDDFPDESEEPSVEESETPAVTASASASASPSASVAAAQQNLLPVGNPAGLSANRRSTVDLTASDSGNRTKPENWLGKSYSDKEVAGQARDQDNDGYADWLEEDLNSDPADSGSIPLLAPVTSLVKRLKGLDDDADGLTNTEEQTAGTSPTNPDSDGDGCPDGAESLSGNSPADSDKLPVADRDGDCLSTEFENSIGLDPGNQDTDKDSLRDDLELAIGSNPFKNDTDSDGILDGKELQLGSDPLVPELTPAIQN